MSNKYWRILLLISVLLVTRPATAHGSAATLSTTKSYDGLITEWETTQFSNGTDFTAPGTTQSKTTYAFSYDTFGRLTQSARFASEATTSDNAFTERNLSYDKNGNLLSLTRYGNTEIKDNFSYSYSGNKLKKLEGTFNGAAITHAAQTSGTTQASGTADYLYDGNGNMTYDALRHLALSYDLNNLVNTVSRNDTLLSTYTYLADGTKYKIIDAAGNGRSYIGPFCLAIKKSGSGSSTETKAFLESIEKDGGRILAIEEETGSGTNSQRNTSYTTLFFIKDHLGSIRTVTDAQGHILERNAYYPFGLQTNQNQAFPIITTSLATLYPNSISFLPARHDLYNGKEIQTAAGTDYLDYGFRQYDPTTARWFNIDPMADSTYMLSPNIFCINCPINTIDSVGCRVTDYYNIYGYLLFKTNDGLNTIIVLNEASAQELEAKLNTPANKNRIDDPEFNMLELHILGNTLQEYCEYYIKDKSYNYQNGLNSEYKKAYNGEKRSFLRSLWSSLVSALEYEYNVREAGDLQDGQDIAWLVGRSDRKNGMINRLAPHSSLKNNHPIIRIH